jgi:hypothetical protein
MEIILFVLGVIIGGLISWFITHSYYAKSSKEQKELIDKLSRDLKETNTLKYFELLLEKSVWKKEYIEHKEIWVSETDNTFQIESGEPAGEFHEPWTKMYPDQNTTKYPVYLKINNTTIKELSFLSLDGGRIFVPMTKQIFDNDKVTYQWNINSLEMKVCNIIGEYYIYKDIYGVARISKVEIINK